MKSKQTTAKNCIDNKALGAVFGLRLLAIGFSPRHETME
jgi:hypothetical protein